MPIHQSGDVAVLGGVKLNGRQLVNVCPLVQTVFGCYLFNHTKLALNYKHNLQFIPTKYDNLLTSDVWNKIKVPIPEVMDYRLTLFSFFDT